MNEARLRELLREVPVPDAGGAEQRGRAVVTAAFAERAAAGERAHDRRPSLPRLALALAIATLLAAVLLSPAGAAVRDWVDDVLSAGVRDAAPALTEIPSGGRLLVQSGEGPWVVEADGARRLLGRYDEATWSPRGLYVAAASGRTLSALEPDGDPRWSLSPGGAVADPRWSPSRYRIAYRAGDSLRVTGADGTGDRALDRRVEPLPPSWSSRGLPLLAYVSSGGELRIAETESGSIARAAAPALPGVANLEWSPDDSALLETGGGALRIREVGLDKLIARIRIGSPRELSLPKSAAIRDAAFAPDGNRLAVLLRFGPGAPRSAIVLADPQGGPPHTLFATPGRLAELAWSPDGSRLLIAWPEADQWLFVPADGRSRVRAIGDIAAQFAPGHEAAATFPRVAGWCCRSGS
jgi:dipeptidyl aminopeptidase/acylaminoacyl peptidase